MPVTRKMRLRCAIQVSVTRSFSRVSAIRRAAGNAAICRRCTRLSCASGRPSALAPATGSSPGPTRFSSTAASPSGATAAATSGVLMVFQPAGIASATSRSGCTNSEPRKTPVAGSSPTTRPSSRPTNAGRLAAIGVPGARGQRAGGSLDAADALGRRGVRREEARAIGILAGQLLLALERPEKGGQRGRAHSRRAPPARCRADRPRAPDRDCTRPAPHSTPSRPVPPDDAAQRRTHRAQDGRRNPEDHREGRGRADPARGVTLQHVRHLVADQPRPARPRCSAAPAAPASRRPSRRERERIGVRIVRHVESPGDVGTLRRVRQSAAHLTGRSPPASDRARRPTVCSTSWAASWPRRRSSLGDMVAHPPASNATVATSQPPHCPRVIIAVTPIASIGSTVGSSRAAQRITRSVLAGSNRPERPSASSTRHAPRVASSQ